MRNICKILVRNPEVKKPLDKTLHLLERTLLKWFLRKQDVSL